MILYLKDIDGNKWAIANTPIVGIPKSVVLRQHIPEPGALLPTQFSVPSGEYRTPTSSRLLKKRGNEWLAFDMKDWEAVRQEWLAQETARITKFFDTYPDNAVLIQFEANAKHYSFWHVPE